MKSPFDDVLDAMEIDGVFIPLTSTCVDEAEQAWKERNLPKKRTVRKTTYWQWAVKQVLSGGNCEHYDLEQLYLRRINNEKK